MPLRPGVNVLGVDQDVEGLKRSRQLNALGQMDVQRAPIVAQQQDTQFQQGQEDRQWQQVAAAAQHALKVPDTRAFVQQNFPDLGAQMVQAGFPADADDGTWKRAASQYLSLAQSKLGIAPVEEQTTIAPAGSGLIRGGQMVGQVPFKPDAAPGPTDDMREYDHARRQGFAGSFMEYQTQLRKSGATSVDARTYPNPSPGQHYEQDPNGGFRLVNTPGGPQAVAAEERQKGAVDQGNIVTQDIDRALERMNSGFLPDVGFGAMLANIPYTDAKAISGFLQTVKANIGFEKLNQMRRQSPTGGALGNVTEKELAFLQAVAGNLDQSQEKGILVDNLNRLWNAMQDVVHGPQGGPDRRGLSFQNGGASGEWGSQQGSAPGGVVDWGSL